MASVQCADCGGNHATGLCQTFQSKLPGKVPTATERVALKAGMQLGTFRLKQLIGRGASSDVFLGENELTGAITAVKVLRAELHEDEDMVRRFEAEARTTNLVRHEHIVEILDIGIANNWQHYILLEYLDGVTLATLIERGVEHALATKLVLQLCAALGAAHAKGVVHRDLKPANVFVVRRAGLPHAKLVDFGMAHREKLGEGEQRTRFGSILGTALYMSPEQAMGGQIDGRTDVYALGVMMYELATGRPPFIGTTPMEVMHAHMRHAPKPPREINAKLHAAYEQVILRCLAKEPPSRYQSMHDLGRGIVMALDGRTEPERPAVARRTSAPMIDAPFNSPRSGELPTQPAGSTTMAGVSGVRRQPRVPTSFGVQLFDERGALLGDALVTDVSLGGAFIRSALTLPPFARVRLSGSTSAGALDIVAEIVRIQVSDAKQRGFGVRFIAPTPAQLQVLEALQKKGDGTPVGDPQGEAVLQQFEPRVSQGHYALLGLPRDASTRRIRDVCERLHEELAPSRFPKLTVEQRRRCDGLRLRLTEVEEELIDPERRALYDAVNGNVLGVLRCITEGLDLGRLEALRVKFLKARPDAEAGIKASLEKASRAEREGRLDLAMQALADALCIDPLNVSLHRRAAALRTASKSPPAAKS
jgi:serine/threonine-protein kinase